VNQTEQFISAPLADIPLNPGKTAVAVNFHQLETPKTSNPVAEQKMATTMFSRWFLKIGIPVYNGLKS